MMNTTHPGKQFYGKVVYKTKPELALEMVYHARALGMRFNWTGADSFYANDPAFCRGLDDMGEL